MPAFQLRRCHFDVRFPPTGAIIENGDQINDLLVSQGLKVIRNDNRFSFHVESPDVRGWVSWKQAVLAVEAPGTYARVGEQVLSNLSRELWLLMKVSRFSFVGCRGELTAAWDGEFHQLRAALYRSMCHSEALNRVLSGEPADLALAYTLQDSETKTNIHIGPLGASEMAQRFDGQDGLTGPHLFMDYDYVRATGGPLFILTQHISRSAGMAESTFDRLCSLLQGCRQ